MPLKARRHCLTFLVLSLVLAAGIARAQADRNISSGGPTWTGRVVDAEGRPLPGVEIWPESQAKLGRIEHRPATVSGPDGLFTVPIAWGTMTICPAERVPAEHRPSSSHPREPVEIRLQSSADMAGRVVDVEGETVPGIDVMATFAGGGGGWATGCVIHSLPQPCLGNPHFRTIRTDAEGRFVFAGMEPGWFVVSALNGSLPETVRWQAAAGKGGRELEIVLPRKLVLLEGQVVDAEGKPVEGAQVMISGVQPPVPAQTDVTGAFRFSRAAPGPQLLQVSHPDLGWMEKEILIEESRLDVRMPRASLVQGRIAGRDGSPVTRPMVSVDFRHVESDSEGRFQFSVAAGEHVVRVFARNWARMEKTITATGDPIELNLEMSRPAAILGQGGACRPELRGGLRGVSPERPGRGESDPEASPRRQTADRAP